MTVIFSVFFFIPALQVPSQTLTAVFSRSADQANCLFMCSGNKRVIYIYKTSIPSISLSKYVSNMFKKTNKKVLSSVDMAYITSSLIPDIPAIYNSSPSQPVCNTSNTS